MPIPRISALGAFVASGVLFALSTSAIEPAGKTLAVAPGGKPGFTRLSPKETGITFLNHLEELDGARNRTLYNGSGVAVGDFDGDGLPDVFFASLEGKCRLYKNLGGFKFKDVTATAGVECFGLICRGATFADVNGDGRLDLLVGTSGQGVRLFLNDGKGSFVDASRESGLTSRFASLTMALADVNGDGVLDLYVANNRLEDQRDRSSLNLIQVDGKLSVPSFLRDRFTLDKNGAILEYGEPDQLYLNDGKGHFSPVPWTGGAFLDEDGQPLTAPPLDWGLTATFRDINGDGHPDLYVCNDYWTPDRIWLGDGKGGFRAAPRLSLRSTSASSMGVDFADIDHDGHVDLMVVDMLSRDHQRRKMQMGAMKPTPIAIGSIDNRPQIMRNTLQLNRGDGTFAEIANFAGVQASEWSWQPLFLDVDLDGWDDLIISSGHFRDVQDADTSNKIKALQSSGKLVDESQLKHGSLLGLQGQDKFTAELLAMARMRPQLESPLVAFRNVGGLHFEPAEKDWGTDELAVHHGLAYVDLDGDGDLDLVVNNLEGPAGVYRNNSSAARVAVRLKGPAGNSQGAGAKVKLLGGAVPEQWREVVSGGRYLSGCDTELCFAAGKSKAGMSMEVLWPGGSRSVLKDVLPNRLYTVDAASAQPAPERKPLVEPAPLFTDVSALLNHTHHENEFDDFKRQLLLPNRLSQLGPGVAWADLNGDGRVDLLIGSGAEGSLAEFLNDGNGGFTPAPPSAGLAEKAVRDQTGIVSWGEGAGVSVLVGSASFEPGTTDGDAALWTRAGKAAAGLPDNDSSSGAIAVADVDGDGALDVFLGGRSVPGRYPEAASSRLFRRVGERFVSDEKANALFAKLGLVSGAVFSDLNGDGAPDLVLALEWGPVTVFLNDGKGGFRNATAELGLSQETGWWNGVTTGDLDGDGRMDIVATNWGLNSKYEHHYDAEHPLLVYWGEFNHDGLLQVIEGHFDHAMHTLVPERGLSCSSTAMPFIKTRTPNYTAFGGSGLNDIYGDLLKAAPSLSARSLTHKVFLNRGDHFEIRELPLAAQLAPGFGVNVGDVDGDGHEDVFMTQNFFATQIETPRNDAGTSLWLKGDGAGALTALSAAQSGVHVWGDARGSALADYDGDGRVDLVVTQNGGATRLFHNTGARPGLRVSLDAGPGNTTGIGAQTRLLFGTKKGPVREIHGGSGYWSQDAALTVLATPEAPSAIWVRWPGGTETTMPIAAGATEVKVRR